ncbi:MAG: FAD-binding protein [Oscillibacter sp.]
MRLQQERFYDVLVVGAGIAGITAAMEAAEAGSTVLLTSGGATFSGSSFYPGTWGLGLIGPEDEGDCADLAATICRVGCGMADPVLVRTFVAGIAPAIEKVRAMGVKLRRADSSAQKEFIPCFDHKHRDWNGIEFDSARRVFSKRMAELGIETLPHSELLELVQRAGRVEGGVFAQGDALHYFGCNALILATGGYGGLYKYRLTTADVTGCGQALALRAGGTLTNMEFLQMMPGYITPAPKTIFNEKTFRFTELKTPAGLPLLGGLVGVSTLLEERSTHGPFTSRLSSKAVDFRLMEAFLADARGVTATYTPALRENPPEFIRTYFDWLREEKHLTPDDPIQLGIFAHAANGGIRIGCDGSAGVPGLFACGEVTGGMHGADRLGGLSTANGLVFGGKAGRGAAAFCKTAPATIARDWDFDPWATEGVSEAGALLQETMFRTAMLLRSEAGLQGALDQIAQLQRGCIRHPATRVADIAGSRRLENQLITATCILQAAQLRRESRGSHNRTDFPAENPAMGAPITVTWAGAPAAHLEEQLSCQ